MYAGGIFGINKLRQKYFRCIGHTYPLNYFEFVDTYVHTNICIYLKYVSLTYSFGNQPTEPSTELVSLDKINTCLCHNQFTQIHTNLP